VSDTVVVRDTDPDVAVSVTVAAPSVAVLDAVNVAVTVLPVVAVDGLNATLTPLGSPEAAKFTAPVKLVRLIATEVLPAAPRATDTAGAAPSVKSLVTVPFTFRITEAAFETEPDVPVMVTVDVPRVAVLDAVNVNVVELPVVDEGLNEAVTPLGNPLIENAMALVKLLRTMLIVAVAVAPRTTVTGLPVELPMS
jgi:hypothetical protein